jgi:hypothetical protein
MRLRLTPVLLAVASAKAFGISDYIRAASRTPIDDSTFPSQDASTTSGSDSTSPIEPCAQVSTFFANSRQAPADVALQCLRSVPLDAENDKVQLQGVIAFVSFQSTLVRPYVLMMTQNDHD